MPQHDWKIRQLAQIGFTGKPVGGGGGGGGGPVLPQVASATLLLNLQADTLALNDNDPVSSWTDASGNGHDFTQTGNARPTFASSKDGFPAVAFDGLNFLQWMSTPAFADNLDSFAVFYVAALASPGNASQVITKLDNSTDFLGWEVNVQNAFFQDAVNLYGVENEPTSGGLFKVRTAEYKSRSILNVYVNGNDDADRLVSPGPITNYSNTEPVRLGVEGAGIGSFSGLSGWIRAVLLYAPAPNATDRQSIESWLAARYGVNFGFPTITLQPAPSTLVVDGQTVNLSADAIGTPAPTIQWQKSLDGGQTWQDVIGETSTTYTFVWHLGDPVTYRAVFTNVVGSLPTDTAILTL